ncbi:MAG: CDGSH iron-sulfur domain-containing protein [Xanthomonadales bacterium]|nr:CDGSH iron-sulfur domain-containing protein [Gammaproteobacteria bacterium]MBT8076386.1 CDGSH iron-sulfur domain-containing protein [Gammaproteobacteria bacterium]NNK03907.1 CDGSH iron-sulfur domain-containing protein [Xanthomonadales bacterium]NNK99487.1 CDGSH iron-sulfur domain-containing protein [Xanthomonadales bacterium]
MDDATTAYAKPLSWPDSDEQPASTQSNPNLDSPAAPEPVGKQPESTNERTLDRWFLEQRGSKRVPKRLDITNELLVSPGGPLKMTGNITLIDEDGNVSHSNNLNLCRCGASKNSPLCDDQHLDIEFFDSGAVTQISDWMPVNRPQTVTVTVVKDGPLKFRGYLRIFNKRGQECITMNGSLCRCGKSSKKPFCDSKHGCCSG